jgi:hypothetical protein
MKLSPAEPKTPEKQHYNIEKIMKFAKDPNFQFLFNCGNVAIFQELNKKLNLIMII